MARYIKSHRALAHEVLHACGLQPNHFKVISPIRQGLKWHPCFPIHILASKEAALEEASTVHTDVQFFSDGSGLEGGIRVAAVLFKNGQEK